MCGSLENCAEGPCGCLPALHHVMIAIIIEYTRLASAFFDGMAMCIMLIIWNHTLQAWLRYLLVSNNAPASPCKHDENGSENATKIFALLPEASPCKHNLRNLVLLVTHLRKPLSCKCFYH